MSEITIGKVTTSHGLKGQVKVQVADENPLRFTPGREIYLGEDRKKVTVESYRSQGTHGILQFAEYHDINAFDFSFPSYLYSLEEDLPPLPEGRYYFKDLIGLSVQDETGKLYGTLEDILAYGNDVYVIRTPKGDEVMYPANRDLVTVDLSAKRITVVPIEGLFDEN